MVDNTQGSAHAGRYLTPPSHFNHLFSIENGCKACKSRENSDLFYHLSINSEHVSMILV